MTARAPIYCSFCGCTHKEAAFIVTGADTAICDACVDHAAAIIAEKRADLAGAAEYASWFAGSAAA